MQDMVRVKYDMVGKNDLIAQRRIGLYHHFLGVFEWKGYRYIINFQSWWLSFGFY